MQERISVSGLCFPAMDLLGIVDQLESLGVLRTTLPASKFRGLGWDVGLTQISNSGVAVAALIEGPFELTDRRSRTATRSRIIETIDAADVLGAEIVYMPTGPHVGRRWEDAASAFFEAVGPVLEHARDVGVQLAIEPTNWVYADISFVHSIRDALEVVAGCHVGICVDLFHVWAEAGLHESLGQAANDIALVQVSDYVFGDRSFPARAVPGDGVIPLSDLLSCLVTGGYAGPIDIELAGPRIDAEGTLDAVRRAVSMLRGILKKIDVDSAE